MSYSNEGQAENEEMEADGRICTTTVSYEGNKKIIRKSYRAQDSRGSYREPQRTQRGSYREPSPRGSYREFEANKDGNRPTSGYGGDSTRGSNYTANNSYKIPPGGGTVQTSGLAKTLPTKTSLNYAGSNQPPKVPGSNQGNAPVRRYVADDQSGARNY